MLPLKTQWTTHELNQIGAMAEWLWNNTNINKRFDIQSESEIADIILNQATSKQFGYIKFLSINKNYLKIYEILKNLGLKTL